MIAAANPARNDDGALPVAGLIGEGRIVSDAYRQVKARLSRLVEDCAARGRYQLPPEDELGAVLGVSRPTVRSALLSLQKEGKIQRIHGRGTFINRYALRLGANVTEDRPFVDLLDRLGYAATVRTLSVSPMTLPDRVIRALELPGRVPGVAVERVFEADGAPAVFSTDYVPESLLTAPASRLDAGSSTFEFLESNTGHRVQYSVAELVPSLPSATVSVNLGITKREAVLLLSHLHVDAAQRPIAVTEAYLNDAIIRFSVVRTYLDS